MKNTKIKLGIFAVFATLFSSCAQILGDMLFPNYCQECKVIDTFGDVLWSSEECGGGQAEMEEECKAKAYDEGQWKNNVRCECSMK